jgi:hypothetical protein
MPWLRGERLFLEREHASSLQHLTRCGNLLRFRPVLCGLSNLFCSRSELACQSGNGCGNEALLLVTQLVLRWSARSSSFAAFAFRELLLQPVLQWHVLPLSVLVPQPTLLQLVLLWRRVWRRHLTSLPGDRRPRRISRRICGSSRCRR